MNQENTLYIPYPRRRLLRSFMRLLGRSLIGLLGRPSITGLENLQHKGPLILAGSHSAMMEVVMMVVYAPRSVEIIGADDIPMRPPVSYMFPVGKLYGFIPIQRGQVGRETLEIALSVLEKNGIIGIFPEGGFTDSAGGQAHTGVAWLSYKAQAPVVPIGFGGTKYALAKMFRFRYPRMYMNIGQPVPPLTEAALRGKALKPTLLAQANLVMQRINELSPDREPPPSNEYFDFAVYIQNAKGDIVSLNQDLPLPEPGTLGRFFHRAGLFRTMHDNLGLPTEDITVDTPDPARFARALEAVIDYLSSDPHFLGYRFGYKEGETIRTGLSRLRDIARWAAKQGLRLRYKAVRRYSRNGKEVVEHVPKSS